jgi:hypothetical protein
MGPSRWVFRRSVRLIIGIVRQAAQLDTIALRAQNSQMTARCVDSTASMLAYGGEQLSAGE